MHSLSFAFFAFHISLQNIPSIVKGARVISNNKCILIFKSHLIFVANPGGFSSKWAFTTKGDRGRQEVFTKQQQRLPRLGEPVHKRMLSVTAVNLGNLRRTQVAVAFDCWRLR